MNTTALQKQPELGKLTAIDVQFAESPMQLLSMAVQRGADVGTLERLTELAERFERKNAKREFDTALAAFQSECPVILKTVAGAKSAYRFAPLDHVISQVKTILEKHGFSYGLTSICGEKTVKAIIKITHRDGHSESSEFECPIDTQNPMMTAPQRFGGAMTFAKRYAFCNAFGILTADEDRDGASARPKKSLKEAQEERHSPAGRAERSKQKPALKARLWYLMEVALGKEKRTPEAAQAWLRSKKIIDATATLESLDEPQLTIAIEKTEIETGLIYGA